MRITSFCLPTLLVLATVPAVAQPLQELASPVREPKGYFGTSVAGVPDANGDGVSDFVVGAPNEGTGRAYVFSGLDGARLLTLSSPNAQEDGYFGVAVAGIPDVDGDGRGDVAVGALEDVGPKRTVGQVYVFSGATGALLHTLSTSHPVNRGSFGSSVTAVDDVDGDGLSDVLVGAPGESFTQGATGRAHLFSGATGDHLRMFVSPTLGFHRGFGSAVVGVGDLDGDGHGEMLVGESGFYAGVHGRAYLFSGASGALLLTLASPLGHLGDDFGASVAEVPDTDGDGVPDLLVGAHAEPREPEPTSAGRAYLFSGSSGALLHALVSPREEVNGDFGSAVAGLGDVDGDGRGDLLIGAGAESGWESGAGGAYVFSGASGTLLSALYSPNERNIGGFGSAVARLGDIDGDGLDDLLVGAPREGTSPSPFQGGRAYAFSGALPPLTLTVFPLASPVPRGDTLRLAVTVINNAPIALSGDLRLRLRGNLFGFTYDDTLATGISIGAGATATRTFDVPVGFDFRYDVYAGTVTALVRGDTLATAPFRFTVGAVTAAEPTELVPTVVVAPNPSRGRAELRLALMWPSPVRLSLYDVLGREVAAVDAGRLAAGPHRLPLDLGGLPAGVYVWRLSAAEWVETGRLTVTR